MKRSMILILMALVLALTAIFAGCGAKPAKPTEAPAGEAAPVEIPAVEAEPAEEVPVNDDWAYIQGKGEMIIGYTMYAPMNYVDEDGNFVGFDTEFAEAVCAKLGIKPNFVEINWDTKEVELAAKGIDCIWNGLTVTEERKQNMAFSDSYIKNMQVAVIRKADASIYTDTASMADANLTAEISSAGESAIQADANLASAAYVSVPKQTDALLEVKAGTSDVAILDYTLAKAMVGEGTDYADLQMVEGLELAVEEYAIGFRLGSSVVEQVNKAIEDLTAEGVMDSIAATYDLTASLLSNQ